jgi:hypothetical protein
MGDRETNPGLKRDYYRKALYDLQQVDKIEPGSPVIAQMKNRISAKISK